MTKSKWELFAFDRIGGWVNSLAVGPGGVWAGGLGGVARYSDAEGWSPPNSTIALHCVISLAYREGVLLAGHESGIVRSSDGGKTWESTDVGGNFSTTTAFAFSPRFAEEGVALASTFGSGVLRTTDGGRSWRPSNFGLDDHEVMSLAWQARESVVAATQSGLFHSPNGGRAWRTVPNTNGIVFNTLTWLPDGALLTAPNMDRPRLFSPDLTEWEPVDALPGTMDAWSITTLPGGMILLGGGIRGLWVSADSARSWTQLWQRGCWSVTGDGERIFAGPSNGLACSKDRGQTWTALPHPPLQPFHWMLPLDDAIVIAGVNADPILHFSNGEIEGDDHLGPLPYFGFWKNGPGSFIASTESGLFLYENGIEGQDVANEDGCTQATFLGDDGWAGATSGGQLLRTHDGGRTWSGSPSPFGNLPLVALQAIPNLEDGQFGYLMAATYDERNRSVKVWRSDDGERWTPGADSYTPWSLVATLGEPAVVTVGSVISTRQSDGTWNQSTVGETAFRRLVFDGSTLYALAVDALWRSDHYGKTWSRDDDELPTNEMLDIAIFDGKLHLLLTGGRLLARVS
ncbi:MAG: WD40/YVTN/BNR-like repeat-containing protein [Thermomicrobiales bacterium]